MGKAAARSRRERNLGWLETPRRLCAAPPPPPPHPYRSNPHQITQHPAELIPLPFPRYLLYSTSLVAFRVSGNKARVWVLSIYSI